MFAEPQEIEAMVAVQNIDLEVMQAKKKRVELPQRLEAVRLQKKRGEVEAKLDQVCALQKKAEGEMTIVEDEDRALREKQQRAQEIIDTAGSDYRKVESQTRDMASVAKRREEVAARMVDVSAQLDKIRNVRNQLEQAIEALSAEEARLRSSFEGEDSALVERIAMLQERRTELVASIAPSLMELYDKTRAKAGGVALGKLNDDTCGVCRTKLEGGRLIEVRAAAPLGICPTCKRLLVVED